jgi:serine/threonine protein kinase
MSFLTEYSRKIYRETGIPAKKLPKVQRAFYLGLYLREIGIIPDVARREFDEKDASYSDLFNEIQETEKCRYLIKQRWEEFLSIYDLRRGINSSPNLYDLDGDTERLVSKFGEESDMQTIFNKSLAPYYKTLLEKEKRLKAELARRIKENPETVIRVSIDELQRIDISDPNTRIEVLNRVKRIWLKEAKIEEGRSSLITIATAQGKRYRLTHKVKGGGYGEIYAAVEEASQQRVAIKILRCPHKVSERDVVASLREYTMLKDQADNNGLVKVHDVGYWTEKTEASERENYFIIMDLMEGKKTLQEIIAQRIATLWEQGQIFSTQEIIDTARSILKTLEPMHADGKMHADLKPDHIFVDRKGKRGEFDFTSTTLVDLGIALCVGPDGTARVAEPAGTPYFMAPEAAAGVYTPSVDLYALGCILHLMLTGIHPFQEGSFGDIMQAKRKKDPPDIREYNRNIPPLLAQFVMILLKKNTEERFASAKKALEALEVVEKDINRKNGFGNLVRHPYLDTWQEPTIEFKQQALDAITEKIKEEKVIDNIVELLMQLASIVKEEKTGAKAVVALDLDLGEGEVRELFKRLSEVLPGDDNDELMLFLKNLVIISGSGKDLAKKLWNISTASGKGKVDPKNIIVITKNDDKHMGYYETFKKQIRVGGSPTVVGVDNEGFPKNAYLPILEIMLFSVAKHLKWDKETLLKYYRLIPNVTLAKDLGKDYDTLFTDSNVKKFIIRLIPRAVEFDKENLRKFIDNVNVMLAMA